MTVAELIKYLHTFPQDIPVAYALHSDYHVMELEDIDTGLPQTKRDDGYVERARPDKPAQMYVIFPGN